MGTTTRFSKEPTNIPMELLNKTLSKKKKSTKKDPKASKMLKSFLKPDECIVFVDLENPPLRQKRFGKCLNVVINKDALLERPKISAQPAAKPTNDLSNLPAANENVSNATGNSIKCSASFPVTSSFVFDNTPNSQNVFKNQKASKNIESNKLSRTKKKSQIKKKIETFPHENPEDLPLIINVLKNQKASKNIDSNKLSRTKKKIQIKKKTEILPPKNPKDSPLLISEVFVKGVVLNPQKQPLANVKIEILLNEDILKEVYTSDAGKYEVALEMINKKGYHIDASMEGYITENTPLKRTTSKNQPRNIKEVNFTLKPEKTINSRGRKTELLMNNININDLESIGYSQEVINEALIKANHNPDLIFHYLP